MLERLGGAGIEIIESDGKITHIDKEGVGENVGPA